MSQWHREGSAIYAHVRSTGSSKLHTGHFYAGMHVYSVQLGPKKWVVTANAFSLSRDLGVICLCSKGALFARPVFVRTESSQVLYPISPPGNPVRLNCRSRFLFVEPKMLRPSFQRVPMNLLTESQQFVSTSTVQRYP